MTAEKPSNRINHYSRGAAASLLFLLLQPWSGATDRTPRFYPDDPHWEEPDRMAVPKPASQPGSKLYDLLHKTFAYQPELPSERAHNINTVGGVPNSSWFTNRVGFRTMTLEELRRGPNQLTGPDLSGKLIITSLKLEGVSPGFVFRDPTGEVFFCKVDVKRYPQMATSAEVITSRFFHAFGYHVPENYLVLIHPDQLELAAGTRIEGTSGKRTVITQNRLKAILADVPRRADGRIQVMASRRLPGQILGPFAYQGTRPDDANDVFDHEHHRELRGLRVFASWLNHNDSDSANTLDTYLGNDGEGYVRHYLIDFGTTLGSGAVVPHLRRAGHEYFIEKGPMLKAMASLGIWTRPWQTVEYPEYPSVGFFGDKIFDPPLWRPDYPNPAFDNMESADAFWAARIVAHFSDEMVRALVAEGRLLDKEAEEYLVRSLLGRRNRIIQHYFSQTNPLADWRMVPATSGQPAHLEFRNWGVEHQVGQADGYRYQWFAFDNFTRERTPLGEASETPIARVPIAAAPADYLVVEISTHGSHDAWSRPIEVYLENAATPRVVGVERTVF